MGDVAYRLIRAAGYPIYWITSRPVLLHAERTARAGGYILAPNHLSPYDVPALMGISHRPLDFLSIVEMKNKPAVHHFFKMMNCEFIDRSRRDVAATTALAHRLKRGRAVAMFPEASIRTESTSALFGGPFKPGVVRLAQLTGAPILPCAILGTAVYSRFSSWYPTRSVRFGVNVGEPILVPRGANAVKDATELLVAAYRALGTELQLARGATINDGG